MRTTITILLAGAVLAGCAGRDPVLQPVALHEDTKLNCSQLQNRAYSAATTAQAKINSNNQRDGGDVAMGAVGMVLFWPALLAMDVKNADGHEGNNLADRVEHLKRTAARKGCDVSGFPTVTRYQ